MYKGCSRYEYVRAQPTEDRKVPPLWMSTNGGVSNREQKEPGWLKADTVALRCMRAAAGAVAFNWRTDSFFHNQLIRNVGAVSAS